MSRLFKMAVGVVTVALGGGGLSPPASHAQTVSGVASQRAFLDQYCVRCHSDSQHQRGVVPMSLQGFDLDVEEVGARAELWEKVVRKVRGGMMPPAGARRPDNTTRTAWITWLETELDRTAAAQLLLGRPMTAHRLNRVEYKNAVRDLIGLEVDVEALLPPDDADAEGFDNNAEVLSVSPTLMERYMTAARRISQLAVGDPAAVSRAQSYMVPDMEVQDDRTSDALPFGTRGGLAAHHHFPLDGDYLIRVSLRRNFYNFIRGLGNTPHQLDVRVDGALVKTFMVGGEYSGNRCPTSFCADASPEYEGWNTYTLHADDGLEVRVPVKAGTRLVGVAFVRRPALDEGVLQPPASPATFGASTDDMQDGNPAVAKVVIEGPFDGRAPIETPTRQKIFVCRPKDLGEETACAKQIINTLARRAYRRQVTPSDVTALLSFYEAGRREGGFDAGIQAVLEFVLTDPEFVFRVERGPAAPVEPGVAYRISDVELASRLSFFLWSSIPDEELLDLAVRGTLSEPSILQQQVGRMLNDDRATALVSNFAGQWFGLRKIRNVSPDPTVFPEFDHNLRVAMQRETELFLETQLREDRSVVELLTANYTFVNERLAQHYGIPHIYGNHFRRVTLPDDRRAGILGQASILTVTSYANRTSPVGRGKWVLDNLLGTPPPPPPPDIPDLEARQEGAPPTSVRARMELHRKNPACATCHRMMDPLGFALENFDGIGRWRTTESTGILGELGPAIDPSGVTPDGVRFEGAAGLRQVLVSRQDEFVRTVIERLLTYAVGRRLEHTDMPTVRLIQREAASHESRWSAVILGVVNSRPFQTRRIGS